MKAKFYICEHCGNLVTTIHNAGVPLVCCGEKMKELLPNTVEASGESICRWQSFPATSRLRWVQWSNPKVDVHHFQWLFVEVTIDQTADSSATSPRTGTQGGV